MAKLGNIFIHGFNYQVHALLADLIGRAEVLKLEQTFKDFELRYSSVSL